jgi:alpha-beta hydrolase superfamily lysophospholipase
VSLPAEIPDKFETPDGTKLHVEVWDPPSDPKCVIVIAHGGAEHVGRYDRLVGDFQDLGALCFGPDHRGQGRSGGKPGHIDRFETYAVDLLHVMTTMRDELPPEQGPDSIPWFLFGHSMGGLIALLYLLDYRDAIPLRGAVISGPLLGFAFQPNPLTVLLAKILAVLLPRLTVPANLPADTICRDRGEVARYEKDPIRHPGITAGWYGAMLRAISRVETEGSRIDVPLLWYAGSGDKVCDHRRSIAAYDRLEDPKGNDQTFELFEGYYHEVHNEPEPYRERAVARIKDWLRERME